MRYFYYVHTGHRIGLDRFHRAAAIINELQKEIDITLLCSDFRIAAEAKEYGVKRSVGIDLVRNIPQIAQNGDKIIFDSEEINPVLLEDMTQFFSSFIRISDDPSDIKHAKESLISPYLCGEGICNALVVDERYFEPKPKTIPLALFFGDDDYEKDLQTHQSVFAPFRMELLMGFYHFLGYEEKLKESFTTVHESESYDKVIQESEILISASAQAVLENLAGGGQPVFLQRHDYSENFLPLFESLGIPIVRNYSSEQLSHGIKQAALNDYRRIDKSNNKVIEFIRKTFDLEKLKPF